MSSHGVTNGWSLEIVRGRDTGKRFALKSGVTVLGNALGGDAGIDLSEQEGTAPRKMAARQAAVEMANGAVILRDLDSPGGTFVNRQRVLAGQARPLLPGDLIQLGGVQLKLVENVVTAPAPAVVAPPQPPAPPKAAAPSKTRETAQPARPASSFVFNLKGGASCRSWDDFLTVSAQRWSDLRDELVSGRLAGFLASVGHSDLAPDPNTPGSTDERLDAWLARLPVSRPAKPELEVHPKLLTVRATSLGGMTSAKIRVTNVGYRLLRSTVRVEPPNVPWLSLTKEFQGRPLLTVEGTDVVLEVRFPETLPRALSATLVVDSNGGTARVGVTLEPAAKAIDMIEPTGVLDRGRSWSPRESLAGVSPRARLVGGVVLGVVMRSLVAIAAGVAASLGIGTEGGNPSLAGPAIAFAAIGAVLGGVFAVRRKEVRDTVPAAFAGACGGVLAAAVVVAVCQGVESTLAFLQASPVLLKIPLWGAIGAGMAYLSLLFVPPVSKAKMEEVG
jgi:hypothetical protein